MLIDADTILDARLALYHRGERWLAVADVHFGYELSQRAAGALFPLWGMDSIESRLSALLADFRPERLIIVGDFVHDRAAREPSLALLGRLRTQTEVVLLAGNHDRRAFGLAETRPWYVTDQFCFHHGDGVAPAEGAGRWEIIGHHHPAGTLRDGAGLALKLPALVETEGTLGVTRVFTMGGGWRGRVRARSPAVVVRAETHRPGLTGAKSSGCRASAPLAA